MYMYVHVCTRIENVHVRGILTRHVPRSYSKVEGTEFVRRDDLCPILQVCKLQFQFVVKFWSKGKVVGKYYTGWRRREQDIVRVSE